MIVPNGFVLVVKGIELWCYIKHRAPQLKLALTSLETKWDSTQRQISSRFLIAGSIYLKRTSKSTHPYQRGRASITGLMLKLWERITTRRLIGVAVSRLVRLLVYYGKTIGFFLTLTEYGDIIRIFMGSE